MAALHPGKADGKSGQSRLAYHCVVVKAGTNVLTANSARLNRAMMASLVAQVAQLRGLGAEVVLVTSGAIAAGREVVGTPADAKGVGVSQMLAAVGQSRLMHAYQELFSKHDVVVAQALLTRQDVERRVGYLNVRETLQRLLENGVVPIVNENDVVDTAELSQDGNGQGRFGDNDTLSALVANLVDADLLLLLTDTGGLYTADPNREPNAELIPRVEHIDASIMGLAEEHRSTSTRGGMASKLLAAQRATGVGATTIIAPGHEPDVVTRVACGEEIGTLFPTGVSAVESRKRWLRSGSAESGGVLEVDAGAARAVRSEERSLLPAGVRGVRGSFNRGDVIAVESDGELIAYGQANYGADELRKLCGARSSRIVELLGYAYGDEAIHRNNMAVL
jgi:glutamate 5-kinase